ncbi:MAG: hypothetical protein EOP51_15325 [Sphingobacteriales bacterium]|nr:MAG: hypothetical protein EOP51_15325 [Sphingobacteriales bacterium]
MKKLLLITPLIVLILVSIGLAAKIMHVEYASFIISLTFLSTLCLIAAICILLVFKAFKKIV